MLFKKPLFGKTIPPSCAYCCHSRRAESDESLFYCEKRGVVSATDPCRAYQYDPLRRIPKRQPKMPTFSQEDFEL